MSFEWNKTIQQLRKEIFKNAMEEDDYETTYRLDPNPIIEYTLHKIDNCDYEILDKEVTYTTDYLGEVEYDWDFDIIG